MVFKKLKSYGHLVMFSHSVFSLPFGLIAMLWAAGRIPPVSVFVWILIALLAARNGANAFNRIADRFIDAKNHRTANRQLPTGEVSVWEAGAITVLCFGVMALAAWQLNLLCLILLPFAIALFLFYSYTKRITWLCHFILGVACGGAPVGAWIAVTGRISLPCLVLGAAVCFWVAGFDIIYATQDIAFDRQEGLHSVPARFGLKGALWISALSHVASILLLLSLWFFLQRGPFYLAGVIVSAVLLCIEHYNVVPENKHKMIFAAYSINQILSITFFAFAMLDFFTLGI